MRRLWWQEARVLLCVVFLSGACGDDGKSTPTAKAPAVSDLRVRQEDPGFAGQPTRFTLTLGFADPDADVSAMEVQRKDTGETSSVNLPDAQGKAFGLAEGQFQITAANPGDVPMTVALVDAKGNHSSEIDFVIGIQPAPAEEPSEEVTEELKRKPGTRSVSRSLASRRGRVLAR